MNLFSISQLSQFSGIKPHTIRVWEQRYNALKPERSEGNTRYYDDSQLRRLLNIVSLMENGYKVSHLCSLSDENLFSLILNSRQSGTDKSADYYVNQLISAGMTYDTLHFEKVFSLCLLDYGLKEAYKMVVYPVMERIGLLWAGDMLPSANEHFISNIFRQKLSAEIDSLPAPDRSSETWLLFLPENEFHELALLYAHFLIRLSGRKLIYLGSNVPLGSLKSAILDTRPENLLMFLVHYDMPDQILKNIESISSYFTGDRFYLAGNPKLISRIKYSDQIIYLQSVGQLEEILGLNESLTNCSKI
ncbi:MAG: MerR family transcriptional regulator [Pedobacter sp.]|jgi:DNA-binding transcriptional MerR regulator